MGDLFSRFLDQTRTTSSAAGGLEASAPWSITFTKTGKIKCFGILDGECWLRTEKKESPVRLRGGDILLVSGLSTYTLASDLKIKSRDAKAVFPDSSTTFAKIGRGRTPEFAFVGAHTILDQASADLIQSSLPNFILIPSSDPDADEIMSLLRLLSTEYRAQRAGKSAIANQLSHLIFLKALRRSVELARTLKPGWIRSFGPSKILPAISAIHTNPGQAWTIAALAKTARVSRSTLIESFHRETSLAPMQYLTEWRMILARRQLRDADMSIAEIAWDLGYSSESSFSHAFKRLVGSSPSTYRAQA